MAITRDDVLHVAALAQLELSEDEIARLTEQLGDILEAVGKVRVEGDAAEQLCLLIEGLRAGRWLEPVRA